MEEARPSRIDELLGRALFLGAFEMCFPIDVFETGLWLAEHEDFLDALYFAPEFSVSDNHFARFCFAYALDRYVGANGPTPEVAEAARLFENDEDPYVRKHARVALASSS